jgi:hypothetical protein
MSYSHPHITVSKGQMLSPEMSYLTSLFKPWVMSLSRPARYSIESVFRAPFLNTADAAEYAVPYEAPAAACSMFYATSYE